MWIFLEDGTQRVWCINIAGHAVSPKRCWPIDGVINSLLLVSLLAGEKKKKVVQILRTLYFWMDGTIIHQWRRSLTCAQPIAALVWGKHPSPLTFFDRGGDKWTKRPMGEGNGMTAAALLPASEAGGAFCADNRQRTLRTSVSRCHLTQAAAPFSLALCRFPCLALLRELFMSSPSQES